jgi:hypothetical protein
VYLRQSDFELNEGEVLLGWFNKSMIIVVLLVYILSPNAASYMGYDVEVTVGSTKWELHRQTQYLTFSVDSYVKGQGKSSKYDLLKDFAGINKKDTGYSKQGDLESQEKMLLRTGEGPVIITVGADTYNVTCDPNAPGDSDSCDSKIIIKESADTRVEEYWPAYLANYKKISYLGAGFKEKEIYVNNGDKISTNLDSVKLSKECLYRSTLNKTQITAYITPEGIKEDRKYNRTSSYQIALDSTGPLANFAASRSNPYGESTRFARPQEDLFISQDYRGSVQMSFKMNLKEHIYYLNNQQNESWLNCCDGGYLTMPTYYQKGSKGFGSKAKGIFDCTCWKEPGECIVTPVQY